MLRKRLVRLPKVEPAPEEVSLSRDLKNVSVDTFWNSLIDAVMPSMSAWGSPKFVGSSAGSFCYDPLSAPCCGGRCAFNSFRSQQLDHYTL